MANDGLTDDDLEMLGALGPPAAELDDVLLRRADSLWQRAGELNGRLAGRLPGSPGFRSELWPWRREGDTFPFLWARLKRDGAEELATHVGLFVSPGHSNLCLDLEKDRVEAGDSLEELDDVLDFYAERLETSLPEDLPDDLRVWTDPDNVLSVDEFLERDFEAFMADNTDPDHPWPKLGYLLSRSEVVIDDWVEGMADRARALVPVYDAMVERFRG